MTFSRLSFFLILLVNSTSLAGEVKLTGNMIQGGLVFGWAPPETKIELDGVLIKQAETGDFLIGFSRDAQSNSKLVFFFKDGSSQNRLLSIRQRIYDIQRINGLPKRKVIPNKKDLALIKTQTNQINNSRQVLIMTPYFRAGFMQPAVGPVSGVFGSQRILNGRKRRPHYGLDLAAPEGSPIRAASDGIIIFTHDGMFFNGKTIIIDHGLGLRSTYIHMDSIGVKIGSKVKKGQIVGTVGKTGRATGPHLHWTVYLNKVRINPELIIQEDFLKSLL